MRIKMAVGMKREEGRMVDGKKVPMNPDSGYWLLSNEIAMGWDFGF
jgi:hypothetical protein